MLLFYVGENCYVVENQNILRVIPKIQLKKIPLAPAYMAGLLNLGGKVIPVVDFCQLIEKRDAQNVLSSRILLIKDPSLDAERIVGILGEKVKDFLDVPLEKFKQVDFSVSPFPYVNRIWSEDNQIVYYLDVPTFFRVLAADLIHFTEQENHGA